MHFYVPSPSPVTSVTLHNDVDVKCTGMEQYDDVDVECTWTEHYIMMLLFHKIAGSSMSLHAVFKSFKYLSLSSSQELRSACCNSIKHFDLLRYSSRNQLNLT